jgi:hypothetical protein
MKGRLTTTDRQVLRDRFIRETEAYLNQHWDDPTAAWPRKSDSVTAGDAPAAHADLRVLLGGSNRPTPCAGLR